MAEIPDAAEKACALETDFDRHHNSKCMRNSSCQPRHDEAPPTLHEIALLRLEGRESEEIAAKLNVHRRTDGTLLYQSEAE